MQKMKRQLELLRWHAYCDGWPLTIRRIALKGLAKAGLAKSDPATLQNSSDQQFDRRFRVHTRGVVETDQLHLPENRKEHAVEYLPTSAASLGWLLSRLPVSHSEYAFIDLGSGKGRMLLVASEFPFQQIEGGGTLDGTSSDCRTKYPEFQKSKYPLSKHTLTQSGCDSI